MAGLPRFFPLALNLCFIILLHTTIHPRKIVQVALLYMYSITIKTMRCLISCLYTLFYTYFVHKLTFGMGSMHIR
jgi:hypothetical protein